MIDQSRTYFQEDDAGFIYLPFAPVASIESVTSEGASADYEIKGVGNDYILLDQSPAKDVKINYITSGLSDDEIKLAILMLTSTLYDNRSDFVTGSITSSIPMGVRTILNPFKSVFI